MSHRYLAPDLQAFAERVLRGADLPADKAAVVARILVEGDLYGHTTHGLALLPGYTAELISGSMAHTGEHVVLNQRTATELWDGRRLPGPWLTEQAVGRAQTLASRHGSGTVVIRRSHHIACLAAYLERPARAGWVVMVQSSDPAVRAVAPFGGTRPVMTPNPLAFGFPTEHDPVLIDVSMSTTAMGMTRRLYESGGALPEGWAIDAEGHPTTDPKDLWEEPKGALLPLGGEQAGYKGFALGLMIEALTGGLAGHGRADADEGWGATVMVQVWDPEAFGGRAAFARQQEHLAAACRASPARPGFGPVRLPGDGALARKTENTQRGLLLHPEVEAKLRKLAADRLVPWIPIIAAP